MLFVIRILRASYSYCSPFCAYMINLPFSSSSVTSHCRRFFRLLFVALLFNSVLALSVHADTFVVDKIKIEGLQRLPDGTLLNHLPIVVGDPIDDNQVTFAISELYKTGFFADVKLLRDNNTLVVRVVERPSIAEVTFSGNSDIDDDALKNALTDIGVTRGQIYNRALLEKLTLELERVYFSRGKYGVRINTEITELDQNRVDIDITISEGRAALINHINIIGNYMFDDDTLLGELESGIPPAWAILSSADEYSKPKLSGDLERLRSYYLDRGYIKFAIESTQVSISPDKQDIYITINVSEGDRYTISSSILTGEMVVNRRTMEAQMLTRQGMVFSRSLMVTTKKRLEDMMGRIGYAFARVQISPIIDDEKKQVALTYHVVPGEKIYVRRINIFGNEATHDSVFRREMRLMEGSILASHLLERSKIRIQRLPYVGSVEISTIPVPGTNDQVDLKVQIVEQLAGSFNIGAGFSQTQGFVFNVGLTQENLFGTGKRLILNINTDRANTIYSAAFTDPYYTLDGISRTISVSFRDRDAAEELINNFQTTSGDLSISYGIPLTEFSTLGLGYGYSYIKIIPSAINPSTDVTEFIESQNGQTAFNSLTLNASFSHDTRDRTIFASRGSQHIIGMNMTIPGSELEYYKVSYRGKTFIGITSATTLLLRTNLAFGDGYGDTIGLPFFERYFAGGIRTVRGYESNSLGPRDPDPNNNFAIGGNMRVTAGADYIFPVPFVEKPPSSLRLSAFFDIGNVFLQGSPTFDAGANETGFQLDQLRSSVGLSMVWISPIGPLRFSYAETLNDVSGDDLRAFQFSIGAAF